MAKGAVKYAVIDAFTDTPFKGNPAAVCFLEEEDGGGVDEQWMQSVAKEFNISVTAFLTRTTTSSSRFNLRWFTPVPEVELCGHGTVAAAHFLYTSGIAKGDMIEFVTKSGVLTATKVQDYSKSDTSKPCNAKADEGFSIELNFPIVSVVECDSMEIPSIPETLNVYQWSKSRKLLPAGISL
ncbi:Uncharacterized protein M6B38_238145 [Iris pallida]|uniref:Phenazine biosynthesis PhzC/PhzF protein n=1 Tax=Iris pallida TaxID=29817 RepID=A0AAX6DLC3_IRIPA|nr:Uncharacterized protein M6B38_238145 [Iris pallida]